MSIKDLNNISQPTFKRCAHSKRRPFVVIDRQMFHDKSISPKAKGVLGFLLTLPDDWVIHHGQICDALNIGKDYLNSAMDELIEGGYAKRSRETIKGQFTPYTYEFSELKEFLPERENRSGSSAAENPHLLSNDRLNIEKPTTTPQTPLSQKTVSVKPSPYSVVVCHKNVLEQMVGLDDRIPQDAKESIVNELLKKKINPDRLALALEFSKHVVPKKDIASQIVWHCMQASPPQPPIAAPTTEVKEEENKRFSKHLMQHVKNRPECYYDVCNSTAEIIFSGAALPFTLSYIDKNFSAKLIAKLRECKLLVDCCSACKNVVGAA